MMKVRIFTPCSRLVCFYVTTILSWGWFSLIEVEVNLSWSQPHYPLFQSVLICIWVLLCLATETWELESSILKPISLSLLSAIVMGSGLASQVGNCWCKIGNRHLSYLCLSTLRNAKTLLITFRQFWRDHFLQPYRINNLRNTSGPSWLTISTQRTLKD